MIQKPLLRAFTFFHVLLYRLIRGKLGGRMNGLPILLLHTVERKTGKHRVTPLGYFIHEGDYVVTGSNAGTNSHPGWYYNLIENLRLSIELAGYRFPAIAEIARAEQRDRLWDSLVEISPVYQEYAKRINRAIPIVILRRERSTRLNNIIT